MTITATGFGGLAAAVDAIQDARRSRFQGSTLPVVRSFGTMVVAANPNVTLGATIGIGEAWAHGVHVNSDAVESIGPFDPVSAAGQTRWDAVVLRRNWTNNTATFAIVKGVAAANAPQVLPSDLNNTIGGVHDQVLALAKITAGQPLPGPIVSYRLRAHKVFSAPGLWALPTPPTTDLFGMSATLEDGTRYRVGSDASGALAWLPESGQVEVVGPSIFSATSPAGAGWTIAAPMVNRLLISRAIGSYDFNLQLRHSSGTAITAGGTNGNFPNTVVATVHEDYWPDHVVPVYGQYQGAGGTGLMPLTMSLGTSGLLTLISGAPGVNLPVQSVATEFSVRADVHFVRKV